MSAYRLVVESRADLLNDSVRKLMDDGWKINGNHQMAMMWIPDGAGVKIETRFSQVMVRYSEPTT